MNRASTVIFVVALFAATPSATGSGSARHEKIAAVSTGSDFACALTVDGRVLCWGANDAGQLGNRTFRGSPSPVEVSGLRSQAKAISAGYGHACALAGDGSVLCWGENAYGQLGNRDMKNSAEPVLVSGLGTKATAIAAGGGHTCALTASGGVLCWGNNASGSLGNNKTGNSAKPVAVLGLDGPVIALTAGGEHTCALTAKGGLLCWGDNSISQLGNNHIEESRVPVTILGLHSGVLAAVAGFEHTCALSSRAGVLCWGSNQYGQLGGNKEDHHLPTAVDHLPPDVTRIATGSSSSYALTKSGVLRWGTSEGEPVEDARKESLTPAPVPGLAHRQIVAISAGSTHACALTAQGDVLCWGSNKHGALGNGSTLKSGGPVAVKF